MQAWGETLQTGLQGYGKSLAGSEKMELIQQILMKLLFFSPTSGTTNVPRRFHVLQYAIVVAQVANTLIAVVHDHCFTTVDGQTPEPLEKEPPVLKIVFIELLKLLNDIDQAQRVELYGALLNLLQILRHLQSTGLTLHEHYKVVAADAIGCGDTAAMALRLLTALVSYDNSLLTGPNNLFENGYIYALVSRIPHHVAFSFNNLPGGGALTVTIAAEQLATPISGSADDVVESADAHFRVYKAKMELFTFIARRDCRVAQELVLYRLISILSDQAFWLVRPVEDISVSIPGHTDGALSRIMLYRKIVIPALQVLRAHPITVLNAHLSTVLRTYFVPSLQVIVALLDAVPSALEQGALFVRSHLDVVFQVLRAHPI